MILHVLYVMAKFGVLQPGRRKFTFYHQVSRNFWYSFDQPWKDERLSRPLSQLVEIPPAKLMKGRIMQTAYQEGQHFLL